MRNLIAVGATASHMVSQGAGLYLKPSLKLIRLLRPTTV